MPELDRVFRSPKAITIEATTEDESTQLFAVKDLAGNDVFQVTTSGISGSGATFNVNDYSSLDSGGTQSASMQRAVDLAVANGGGDVVFESAVYLGGFEIRDTHGIRLVGNKRGTVIRGTASESVIVNVISAGGSGGVSDIDIENLRIEYGVSSPPGTIALQLWNCLHTSMRNVTLYGGSAGIALNVQGSGNLQFDNVQAYGGPSGGRGVVMGTGGGTLTSTGPLVWNAGQIGSGGGGTGLDIEDHTFDAVFNAPYIYANGDGMTAACKIDGEFTSVVMNGWYGESKHNPTNTGVDMLIGSREKPASVILNGPQQWGHGNGTNYQNYAVQINACKLFRCVGGSWSKLGIANGYNGGIFRINANPAAGDRWYFIGNNKGDVAGPLYSVNAAATDFAGITVGYVGDLVSPLNETINGQLLFGVAGDTNLYRNGANELKTDDALEAAAEIYARHGTASYTAIGNFGPGGQAGLQMEDTTLYRSAADVIRTPDKLLLDGEVEIDGALNHDGTHVGFYGTAPVAKQTGVAVTAAGVHAALVNLGLISA